MILQVITENSESAEPSQEELEGWKEEYGLTFPVMADPGSSTMWGYAADEGGSVGLPFTVVFDRGVYIESIASGTQVEVAQGLL